MTGKKDVNQYIEKILNSSAFCRSGIYAELFEYLVHSSMKGEVPKESVIEIEVFKRSPGDGNIRSYIHKLRKKLDEYYKNEGNHDSLKFTIPKGAYKVEIVKNKKRISKKALIITMLIGIVIINTGIWFISFQQDKHEAKKTEHLVWKQFIENKRKSVIVIGNYFFFHGELPSGDLGIMRDFSINSLNEFNEYIIEHPDIAGKINHTETTYLGRDGIFSLPHIIEPFFVHQSPFEIKISRDVQWDMIRSNNIIYIGSFKNLRILRNITEKLGVKYFLEDNILHYHNWRNDSTYQYSYKFSENKNLDYTFVSLIPGPKGNAILFIISHNDIGCISASKLFSYSGQIEAFKEKYLPDHDYFKALFVAKGMVRTDMTIEPLHVNGIDEKAFEVLWE